MTHIAATISRRAHLKLSELFEQRKRITLRTKYYLMRGAFLGAAALSVFLILSGQWQPPFVSTPTEVTKTAPTAAPAPVVAQGPTQDNPLFAANPTWSQNFADYNGGLIDSKYWNVLVGPAVNSNKEQQYYTDSNANIRIENGALRLIGTNGSYPEGYKYGSARIETQGKQTFLYGRMDITAKLPAGVGTWPAVWMLPANDVYSSKTPASDTLRYKNGGEIDIIEAVGHEPNLVYGVAHTKSALSERSDGTGAFAKINVPTSQTDYNIYTLLWTPTTMTYFVNGTAFFAYNRQEGADYKTWPFDQPFYLIANLALGGTWGGQNSYPNGVNPAALPASLDIKSMYYYPYVGK